MASNQNNQDAGEVPVAVLTQPVQELNPSTWQAIPSNFPPGLECLLQLDGLKVQQKVEMLEVLCGHEMNNKYIITDLQRIWLLFNAQEDNDCCTRTIYGKMRPFDLNLVSPNGQEVIHLIRPLACQSCLFPYCLQSLEVHASGQLIGTVEQKWSFWIPRFVLRDADGNVVLRIEGPMWTFSAFCCDVEFDVMSEDGFTQVGKISKLWAGFCKETFTDADNFEVRFPIDLEVKMKGVMLGALFLIDFMYFEKSGGIQFS